MMHGTVKIAEAKKKCEKYDIIIPYHVILLALLTSVIFGWLDEWCGWIIDECIRRLG